jgi:hypothetical protein
LDSPGLIDMLLLDIGRIACYAKLYEARWLPLAAWPCPWRFGTLLRTWESSAVHYLNSIVQLCRIRTSSTRLSALAHNSNWCLSKNTVLHRYQQQPHPNLSSIEFEPRPLCRSRPSGLFARHRTYDQHNWHSSFADKTNLTTFHRGRD